MPCSGLICLIGILTAVSLRLKCLRTSDVSHRVHEIIRPKTTSKQHITNPRSTPEIHTAAMREQWGVGGDGEGRRGRLYLADNIAGAVFMAELKTWFLGTGVSYG